MTINNYEIKERIRHLVAIIYREYSPVGGELHIVLDDKNLEDYNIKWCLENSISDIEDIDERCVYEECATLLLKLSYSSRKRLLS